MANLQDVTKGHIIDLLKLDYLPEDQRVILLDEMVELVNQKVLLRILESFSNTADHTKFISILDKGKDGELQQFIAARVPNFLALLTEETETLKQKLVRTI